MINDEILRSQLRWLTSAKTLQAHNNALKVGLSFIVCKEPNPELLDRMEHFHSNLLKLDEAISKFRLEITEIKKGNWAVSGAHGQKIDLDLSELEKSVALLELELKTLRKQAATQGFF
jgi:hypothetical protein